MFAKPQKAPVEDRKEARGGGRGGRDINVSQIQSKKKCVVGKREECGEGKQLGVAREGNPYKDEDKYERFFQATTSLISKGRQGP